MRFFASPNLHNFPFFISMKDEQIVGAHCRNQIGFLRKHFVRWFSHSFKLLKVRRWTDKCLCCIIRVSIGKRKHNNIIIYYSPLLYHTSNSVDVIFLWFLFHPMIYLRYYKSIKLYIGVPAMA